MRKTVIAAALVAVAACIHREPEDALPEPKPAAFAKLESKSGATVMGKAEFFVTGMEVRVQLDVTGTMPGKHAVHLHEKGDCSSEDGESAGAHWNPKGHEHGKLDESPAHLGDIGNLEVDAEGKGSLSFSTIHWKVGTKTDNDILGKALVIHEGEDDFTSQPAGNAGKRIACGVVRNKATLLFSQR